MSSRAQGQGPKFPTCWNPKEKSPLLNVTRGLVVKYTGKADGTHKKDAAAVRSNNPINCAKGLFYFEITIKNRGVRGSIGIGLCTADAATNKLPGWEERYSYGYHSDDGKTYNCNGTDGQDYGPTFTTGDVIGCCVSFLDRSCFFTKNGAKLGVAFRNVGRKSAGEFVPLYACVGLRSTDEEIEANFGQQPFLFDFEAQRNEMEQQARSSVDAVKFSDPQWSHTISQLVTSYLAHKGYHETATILARETNTTVDSPIDTIKARRAICQLVLDGKIDDALTQVVATYPGFFVKEPGLLFRLKCRKFTERVAYLHSQGDTQVLDAGLEELLALGQGLQSEFDGLANAPEPDHGLLQDTFSLLAYTMPSGSPVAYLLDTDLRKPLAHELNCAMLASLGQPRRSTLEGITVHVASCLQELRQKGVGDAALLNLGQFN